MTRTLRARLTAWNLLIVASALAVFAVLLYGWLARTLYRHHDNDLVGDAERIADTLRSGPDPLRALEEMDAADTGGPLLMLRDSRGRMLFRSASLATTEREVGEHAALTHAAMRGVAAPRYFTVELEGEPVRFVCVRVADAREAYLQVGRRLGEIDALLSVVAVASAVLIPLVVILTSFGGLAIARRALAPIDQIASTLQSIEATHLSSRVDTRTRDAEVTRLSSSINRLLDRLQASFSAMKDFTAEVSHQLQTPLMVMKGAIDVAQRDPDAERCRRTLAELGEDVDALTATVGDLRDYALADADSEPAGAAPVDASEVFEEAADVIRALAEAHDLTCDTRIAAGAKVWGNAVRLRQVLLNLGENAVQFTPAGGRIRITASIAGGNVLLEVADSGAGIPAEALPRVFDRHFRIRRSGVARGSGLGLAIVKRVVDAHGGRVTLESTLGLGTRAVVTLPAAGAVPPRPV